MPDEQISETSPASILKAERERIVAILEIGRRYCRLEEANLAVQAGMSLEAFRRQTEEWQTAHDKLRAAFYSEG